MLDSAFRVVYWALLLVQWRLKLYEFGLRAGASSGVSKDFRLAPQKGKDDTTEAAPSTRIT